MQMFELSYVLNAFSVQNLTVIVLGTLIGILFGSIPGLGAQITLVLLLPFSFQMEPLSAILMLLAAYQGCEYGGSISSIILGIPGTPAAAATVLDGYQLSQKGQPGKAISYSLNASVIGGIFGGLVLIFASVPVARVAIKMGASEYFLIGMIGVTAVAAMSAKSVPKSMMSGVLGLMAGTVGIDLFTGFHRFTMGLIHLDKGFSTAMVIIGVFAFPEIFTLISDKLHIRFNVGDIQLRTGLTVKETRGITKPTLIGSIIGTAVGIFPGLGSATSSWFSYTTAQKLSKKPDQFGKGNPEGIAAAESANNACVGGALLPLLTLGVPGSPAVAIIMGAFIIHGIQPGPGVFSSNADLVYGIFYGFILTTIALYLIGKLVTPLFIRLVTFPNTFLVPCIMIFTLIGLYAIQSSVIDIIIALIFGIVIFLLAKFDFSPSAFILAFVLSGIIEKNFRRALVLSNGSFLIFIQRTGSAVLLGILLLIVAASIRKAIKKKAGT